MAGHLNPGGQQFRGDHGAADPRVAAALAAYQAGQGSERAALGALAEARLLVPVIAVLAGTAGPPQAASRSGTADPDTTETAGRPGTAHPGPTEQGDKSSEMVLPRLIGRDGRPAVLAFTGLEALARWRPDARPVPAEADRVWRAAVADGCAVVIDVAGPVPLAVEGARLAALAAGQPVPLPHEDPDIRGEVQAAVAGEPVIAGFTLAPGGADGTDLAVRLHLASPAPASASPAPASASPAPASGPGAVPGDWAPAVNRAAVGIAARLSSRLRRGIEVTAVPTP